MSIRVYAETSVFGGVFDDEFAGPSRLFFDQVRSGRFRLVVSALIEAELEPAPSRVRRFYEEVFDLAEEVDIVPEALRLGQAYLDAGIVSLGRSEDALHVAIATVAGCSVIVSWNFRHIVHLEKVPLYNAVSVVKGYREIAIYSPLEVISYEEEV